MGKEASEKDEQMTEEKAAGILAAIYEKALDGVPKVSRSIDEFADDYTARFEVPERAAKELVKYQVLKCGTSGFITGLGGLLALPVAIPANISSVLYVQMRMVAAIAKIGGYDVRSDQVQTLVYMCLTGTAITDVVKRTGIKIGEKTLTAALKKLPGSVLTKINQRIGFRLLTKFGEKGAINLAKFIPVAGGVIGGAVDVASTSVIAKNAIRLFIEDEEPRGADVPETEVIEVPILDASGAWQIVKEHNPGMRACTCTEGDVHFYFGLEREGGEACAFGAVSQVDKFTAEYREVPRIIANGEPIVNVLDPSELQ